MASASCLIWVLEVDEQFHRPLQHSLICSVFPEIWRKASLAVEARRPEALGGEQSMTAEDETLEVLKGILKWTRFQGSPKAQEVLQSTLKSDQDRLIYHNSDGKTSREIAKIAGVTKEESRASGSTGAHLAS